MINHVFSGLIVFLVCLEGERVINMKEVEEQGYRNVTLITDKGTKMKVDLAIPCTGLKTHSVAYKDSLGRYIS